MATRSIALAALCTVGLVASASSVVAAPVSTGHSGWAWGDPSPQGNTLTDVTFAGATGFAVGDRGTVLRSEDGGGTWVGLPSGTRNDLTQVQELDPATVIVGGGCTVRESTNAGASFKRLPVSESESDCATKVASFSFLNATTGFIEQTDGSIFLTTDGGQTLAPKTPVPLNGTAAEQIVFLSPSTGFAVGGGSSGRIFRTTDGANSWTQVAATGSPLSEIRFVSPTQAYAVGANDTLLQSTDAGATWGQLSLTVAGATGPLTLTHISCSDPLHCLISTAAAPQGQTNTLLRTTDGGQTGSLISASEQDLLAVAFSTATNVVAVGENGATALSSDGGASFPTLISHNLGAATDGTNGLIRIGQSPLDAYVPWSAGQIAATTNGGGSWGLLRVPSSASLTDVAFPTTQIGYALSSTGTVFRTANAGLSWSILSAGGGSPDALLAPDENAVLLVGPRGVQLSKNAGETFTPINATVVNGRRHGKPHKVKLSSFDLSHGAQLAGSAIFAYGKDVLRSTDGGRSWTLIPRALAKHQVSAIAFVSAATGYEASDGRLFVTRDAGRRWREIRSVDAADVGSIGQLSFSNVSDGYLIGNLSGQRETVQRTENGGRSWTPEIVAPNLDSVAAGGSVDYALAGIPTNAALFQTIDGGLTTSPSTLRLSLSGPAKLSAKQLKHAGHRVKLTGTLNPASGGEVIYVQWATAGGSWHQREVIASSSGRFTLSISGIKSSTDFFAQWTGNDVDSGAGTPAIHLTVSRR
jgi:photosystem II stability/assembly factor-like uncharacterized protein